MGDLRGLLLIRRFRSELLALTEWRPGGSPGPRRTPGQPWHWDRFNAEAHVRPAPATPFRATTTAPSGMPTKLVDTVLIGPEVHGHQVHHYPQRVRASGRVLRPRGQPGLAATPSTRGAAWKREPVTQGHHRDTPRASMPRLAPGSTQEGNPIGHISQITQGAIHAALSLPHTPVSLNARAFPDRMVPARQRALPPPPEGIPSAQAEGGRVTTFVTSYP